MPVMDAVAQFVSRLPDEVRQVGGALRWRIVLLVVALALNVGFYLPSIPEGIPGSEIPGADKIVHVVVFALTVWAAGRVLAPRARFPMGWVVITAFLHAVFIEVAQGLFLGVGRGADLNDVVAGMAGIALGVGLWIGERIRSRSVAASEEFSTP